MNDSKLKPGNKHNPAFEGGDINISIMEMLYFLKATYKTILIFGMLGVATSIVYLVFAPKKYEAVAQIAMAQIGIASNKNNSPGIIVEDPALLIARLSSPSSFTQDETAICGFGVESNDAAVLAKTIKLAPVKGVPNVIQLKTYGTSSKVAKDCAKAIFDFAKESQAQITAPYIEEVKIKLADYEERIIKARELISRSDREGSSISATYLSTRDEIRYLRDEISDLKNVLASNQNRATRLIAPIYTSDLPASPNKILALAVGLLGGLFLGLLGALFQQMIARTWGRGAGHCDI